MVANIETQAVQPPAVVRVCMGGTRVVEHPLQPMATHETLRNIYCGHIQLPQSDLDTYNRMTAEINRATYHTDREFLLDQRHRFFVNAMYAQRDRIEADTSKSANATQAAGQTAATM